MWHLCNIRSSHQTPSSIPLCLSPWEQFYGFLHVGPANFWLTLILTVFLIVVAIVTGICVGGPMTAPNFFPDSLEGSQDSDAVAFRVQQGEKTDLMGPRNLCTGTHLAPFQQEGSLRMCSFLYRWKAVTMIVHRFSETTVSTSSFHLTSR